MSSAPKRFMVVDLGTAFLKAALYQCDTTYKCLSTAVHPRMITAVILPQLMNEVLAQAKLPVNTAFQLVLIGDVPELADNKLLHGAIRIQPDEAYGLLLKHLSSTSGVVCIDMGSKHLTIGLGNLGQVKLQNHDVGVGQESWSFLRQNNRVGRVRSWLPVDIAEEEIENYIANKSLYPETIPLTPREMAIEQALAKTILVDLVQPEVIPWASLEKVIIMGSVLAGVEYYAQSVGVILDGLEPTGMLQISADARLTLLCTGGLLAALASDDYRPGRALLDQQLRPIGTIVGLKTVKKNRSTKVTLDTGLKREQVIAVRAGEIVCIPFGPQDTGVLWVPEVNVKPHKTHHAPDRDAVGGEIGMVIDGRGRPLPLVIKDNERRVQLAAWDKQLNAHQQVLAIGEV